MAAGTRDMERGTHQSGQHNPEPASLNRGSMFYSRVSLDGAKETFLEKPQGTDFLCASGQQTESVFCWLQLCSSLWGLREAESPEDLNGSLTQGETHQG